MLVPLNTRKPLSKQSEKSMTVETEGGLLKGIPGKTHCGEQAQWRKGNKNMPLTLITYIHLSIYTM